jgi:hypothetical protein
MKVRFEESRNAVDQCHDFASIWSVDGDSLGSGGFSYKTWMGKNRA